MDKGNKALYLFQGNGFGNDTLAISCVAGLGACSRLTGYGIEVTRIDSVR